MTPELAFSHPFISKAVNELKCLRTGSQENATGNRGTQGASGNPAAGGAGGMQAEGASRNTAGNARNNVSGKQHNS